MGKPKARKAQGAKGEKTPRSADMDDFLSPYVATRESNDQTSEIVPRVQPDRRRLQRLRFGNTKRPWIQSSRVRPYLDSYMMPLF